MKLSYQPKSNTYFVNSPKLFENKEIPRDLIIEAYYYAYDQIFEEGFHIRFPEVNAGDFCKNSLFCNMFKIKLAESLIYSALVKSNRTPEMIDIKLKNRGLLEFCDLMCEGQHIKIRTSDQHEDVYLLERSKWNEKGYFIPHLQEKCKGLYDYFLMVRFSNELSNYLNQFRTKDRHIISERFLSEIQKQKRIKYDIPGFFRQEELKRIIEDEYVLPKDSVVNSKTLIDSDKYYIQTGNMSSFSELIYEL